MPEVLQLRGGVIEARHPFSWAAWKGDASVGRSGPDVVTPWRSAAKAFQLRASLELLGEPDLSPQELAVASASHSAEAVHVALVRALLRRFGLAEESLLCGAHPPMHAESAAALLRRGETPGPVHNNCSGKHALMLAAARAIGADDDYRPPGHPVQRHAAAVVHEVTGVRAPVVIDGCGVPCFVLPLLAMARAYSRLAAAMADGAGLLARIGDAMAAHPEITSGSGRLDLLLVRSAREPMAVKVGALGVFCLALPARRLGVAVKVHTGSADALPVAVTAALHAAAPDAWSEPADWPFRVQRNWVGTPVGEFRVE